MTTAKPAVVQIYFDADVLGLAKLLCQSRAEFTYPGDPGATIKKRTRPPCPVTDPGTKDPIWIPVVAGLGWLIITRDRAIQTSRAEINAVRDNGAKMINLSSADASNTWGQLEVFMTRWREVEALCDQDGPFIYQLSRTGRLQSVDLTA